MEKKKKIIIGLIIGVLVVAGIVMLIIFLPKNNSKTSVKTSGKTINENFSAVKEEYTIKGDIMNVNTEIKNTTNKNQKIEQITINVKNEKGEIVSTYSKWVTKNLKPNDSYKLDADINTEFSDISTNDKLDLEYQIK